MYVRFVCHSMAQYVCNFSDSFQWLDLILMYYANVAPIFGMDMNPSSLQENNQFQLTICVPMGYIYGQIFIGKLSCQSIATNSPCAFRLPFVMSFTESVRFHEVSYPNVS